MTKPSLHIAGDYASLEVRSVNDTHHFYFGYEVTVSDEWAFQYTKNGTVVARKAGSELGKGNSPEEMLLLGIAYLIQKGKL